jgi:hypothetical protein
MTQEEFVAIIKQVVFDPAVGEEALRPVGGAIFGFFAALDGSRSIDDPPHGQLRLTYISPDGSEVPLNLTDQVSSREVDDLHALWGAEVFPYTEPLPE